MNYKLLCALSLLLLISMQEVVASEESKSKQIFAIVTTEPIGESLNANDEIKKQIYNRLNHHEHKFMILNTSMPSLFIKECKDDINLIINSRKKVQNDEDLQEIVNAAHCYEKSSNVTLDGWVKESFREIDNSLAAIVARKNYLIEKYKSDLHPLNAVTRVVGNLSRGFISGIAFYSAYQFYNKQSSLFARYICPLTLGSIGLYYLYKGVKKTYNQCNSMNIINNKTDVLDTLGGYLYQHKLKLECINEQKTISNSDLSFYNYKVDPNLQIKIS